MLSVIVFLIVPLLAVQGCPERCLCDMKIDCAGQELTEIPAHPGTSSLKKLDLRKNALTMLPDGAFQNYSHVKTLYLSHNQISQIQVNAFQYLGEVDALDLSYNQIETLSKDVFAPMTQLTYVRLCYNPLKELTGDIFPAPQLISLLIGSCLLENLDAFAGQSEHMSKLAFLSLQNNSISSLGENPRQGVDHIQFIDLYENDVEFCCMSKGKPIKCSENICESLWRDKKEL